MLSGIASMGLTNPAFTVAILPDRALFGLSSSYVKREVRRLLKEEEAVAHPLAAGARPCPGGVDYFGHLDWPAVLGGIYDTAMAFLPLLGDSGALPFDVDALPETATITQYFSPAKVWSKPGEAGTYSVKRSSIGFEIAVQGGLLAAPFAMPGAAGFGESGGESRGFSPREREEVPKDVEEEEDPNVEAQAETSSTLKEVKLALVIFKAENSALPETLEELSVPTASYPKGFLEALPFDGWGRAFFYSSDKEAGSYRLWSAGADGVNNGGRGDDVVSS